MLPFVIEHPAAVGRSFYIKLPKGGGEKAIGLKFPQSHFPDGALTCRGGE